MPLLRQMPTYPSHPICAAVALRQTDPEQGLTEEPVDLHPLDEANPSHKYSDVKNLRRQATWASTQSQSAEV